MLLGFSEGAACGTMLVACMQGAGKASCVELKEELSDVAWQLAPGAWLSASKTLVSMATVIKHLGISSAKTWIEGSEMAKNHGGS